MNSIEDILKPTGVSVEHLFYSGRADPYITYQFYDENGAAFADNTEIATSYLVQVNIFTKNSFDELYKQVLELMISTGWYRKYATEDYEDNTKLKHKIIRFQYVEEYP
ncbi:hypothetical protein [Clostridium tyrobutyricum]|uniref:hypothetical protein n=1 Tax=Clostridium tyrobutyricum TaxID=1519 RepID=UPI000580A86B|nr:hypothetical protein [Clostridium tyrobutyricum]